MLPFTMSYVHSTVICRAASTDKVLWPNITFCMSQFDEVMTKMKKKNFTSFCQPTQPIACANHGNHVQIIM